MPENKNFEFTNYFTQTNKLVPKNYVEVTQEEGTQEPPKFEAQLFYPTTKESGVIDQGRRYVADKANRGRWNATRTKNAEMQQRLFELGAYGEGANQDKVVDGLIGNQTRAALAKAEDSGFLGLLGGMFNLTSAGIVSAIVFGFILTMIFKAKD